MSIQRIANDRGTGEWQVAVARHSTAPTFTFDVTVPAEDATPSEGYEGMVVICCHNMTRADLEQHVANCQAALAEVVPGLDAEAAVHA